MECRNKGEGEACDDKDDCMAYNRGHKRQKMDGMLSDNIYKIVIYGW